MGPRFTVWSEETASLVFGVAVMGEYEQLRRDEAPDAGAERLDPRLSSYVLGRVKLMENMSLVEALYAQPRLTRIVRPPAAQRDAAGGDPPTRFTFTLGFIVTYDAEPPATVVPMDTQSRTSLGVKF